MGACIRCILKSCCYVGVLRPIQKLNQQQSNHTVTAKSIFVQFKGFTANKQAQYYPYNQIYDDKGWGCAWRTIQTFLSPFISSKNKEDIDFKKLFTTYGQRDALLEIITQNKLYDQDTIKIIQKSKFSPQFVVFNWAQPFIGKIICEDKGIPSEIYLLNGYPSIAHAPKDVFEKKILQFDQFIRLISQRIILSPVMIDDGTASLNIMGYRKLIYQATGDTQYQFIIGDPHILSNRKYRMAGIYRVLFNQKGKKIDDFVDNKMFAETKYSDNISEIDFETKKWMVLFGGETKENQVKREMREKEKRENVKIMEKANTLPMKMQNKKNMDYISSVNSSQQQDIKLGKYDVQRTNSNDNLLDHRQLKSNGKYSLGEPNRIAKS